ncbi:MAG: hypothetical protein QN122_13555 [Armatimonadota bacterium]|nr:hypothetical protein [Armatimonadota bacterium]
MEEKRRQWRSMWIHRDTYERLTQRARWGQSLNDVIKQLLELAERMEAPASPRSPREGRR